MIKILLSCLVTAIFSILFGYIVVWLLKRKKANQSILEYVDNHKDKSGTPTMGGLIFLLPTAIFTLLFCGLHNQMAVVSVCVMLAFGLVGWLDDFLKIKHKHNMGLKAYQKIIAQSGIAAIITAYAYTSGYIGSSIVIPFTDITVNLGWWYIPLCFIIYIATTNSVNLTDGLDGLAGSSSIIVIAVLSVMCISNWYNLANVGDTLAAVEMQSMAIYSACLIGGLIGFLWFNVHPAKVFMGDTGSLALGGSIATITIFLKNPLIILLLGIIFVVSSISVIMQVIYFKLTGGKRIFLMAPLHHHLQYKGYKETKIVGFYSIITALAGIITLMSI